MVWNITQARNLSCRHCYQNARHKPLDDELTTDEKLDVIDQLADEFVPFLALAGGEPLVARDRIIHLVHIGWIGHLPASM